jgi:hypothetical protein
MIRASTTIGHHHQNITPTNDPTLESMKAVVLSLALALGAPAFAQTLDPTWPSANGPVWAIVKDEVNDLLYVGGDFSMVSGVPRAHVACLNSDGSLNAWNPGADGVVSSFALDDGLVYVGGTFTNIGGQARNCIAALDASTGLASAWDPNASVSFEVGQGLQAEVNALVVENDMVYAAGIFSTIGGQDRNGVAVLSATTGLASDWNAGLFNAAYSMAMGNGKVYVGISSIPTTLFALDAITGSTLWTVSTGWNGGQSNAEVDGLALDGNTLYFGGRFESAGDEIGGFGARNSLAAVDATSGELLPWAPDAGGINYRALAVNGTNVYIGGSSTLVAANTVTGELTGWDVDVTDQINVLAVSGSTVFTGGWFGTIAGVGHPYLAAFDAGCEGSPCDDGDPCTNNDVFDANCLCAGTPAPITVSLTSNMPVCQGTDLYIYSNPTGAIEGTTSYTWTGPNAFTITYEFDYVYLAGSDPGLVNGTWTVVASNGDCASEVGSIEIFVTPDTDGDGLCDALDDCPNLPGQIGDSCDDGDPDTDNDVITADCMCMGSSGCQPPTDVHIMNNGPICGEGEVDMSVMATGTEPFEYAWTGQDILTATDQASITAQLSTPGGHDYEVTVSNACGSAVANATVIMTAAPAGEFNYNNGDGEPVWCVEDDPAPQVSPDWVAGGTYSAPGGIAIDPVSGVISGIASNYGTFEITYTLPASGGCPEYVTTAEYTNHDAQNWYWDEDNDGAGDPAFFIFGCYPPPGHVGNSDDQCPTDPNKIVPGTCGCGAPEPGQACDDNNDCTIDDVQNEACVCVGTSSPLTVSLYTNLPVCQGSALYILANATGAIPGVTSYAWTGPNNFSLTYEYDYLYLAGANPDLVNGTWTLVAHNADCESEVATIDVFVTPDTDGDGLCDALDDCPNTPGQQGSVCDDGNPCTSGDVLSTDCVCTGTPDETDTDGDGTADCADDCPGVVGQQGSLCDDGDALTVNDVLSPTCICTGTPVSCLVNGDCDDNNPCTEDACDNNACVYTPITTDTDGDGVPDCGDSCPTLAGQVGSGCDDGSALTINDVISPDCVCEGLAVSCVVSGDCDDNDPCTNNDCIANACVYTPLPDNDGDGICDGEDNCPDLTGVQGDACDDGNAATENDVIGADCVCAGELGTAINSPVMSSAMVRYDSANGIITVNNGTGGPVMLLDASGRQLQQGGAPLVRFQTDQLPPGVYIVRTANAFARVVVAR